LNAPRALYIHLPFCISVCPYCDFVVYGGAAAKGPTNRFAATVDALATEIRLRAPDRPTEPLRSIYFGGGTPSLLAAVQVAGLLETADAAFGIASGAEVTLECNPGRADRGDLAGFHAAGVNRLSIGAQSLNTRELRALGRRHAPHDVRETVALARLAGFDNISLDLLYDVPGQTPDSWETTLTAAIELEPEHVSAYALTLDDPGGADHVAVSNGARRWRKRARSVQDDDRAADMYAHADDLLASAGYGWYEISNWAKPRFESRHNLTYWTGAAWEAVGPGAHAFDGDCTRRWNGARLETYLAALNHGKLPPGGREKVEAAIALAEAAILQLRTAEGVPPSRADDAPYRSALAWGRQHGLVESEVDGRYRLTLRGRLLSNELFERLLPSSEAAAVA
jgi:oxygen-independent coproporphyrinogen-3 oxidase